MKKIKLFFLLLLAILTFSCKDDEIDLIQAILPEDERIILKTDTFHVDAVTIHTDSIPLKSNSSSLLLGTYIDSLFGKTQASIFSQFSCPSDWSNYPPESILIADSTRLVLLIKFTEFAPIDSYEDITISAYEMNLGSFEIPSPLSQTYYSNINPSSYTDESILLGSITKRVDNLLKSTNIEIPLSDALKDKFLTASKNNIGFFAKETDFITNLFKGMYITLSSSKTIGSLVLQGETAMMKVNSLEMSLKYAYKNAGNSVIQEAKVFPANREVRQMNRISHSYDGKVPVTDSIVYVNSPAGKHANITIPLKRIKERFAINTINGITYFENKKISVSHCVLRVELTQFEKTSLPAPPYLLLIKKDAVDNFFKNENSPDDISSTVAVYNETTASYDFNLAGYLAAELKDENMVDFDSLSLIPVTISETNTLIIQYNLGLYGASIRTKNSFSPMHMSILISGFK